MASQGCSVAVPEVAGPRDAGPPPTTEVDLAVDKEEWTRCGPSTCQTGVDTGPKAKRPIYYRRDVLRFFTALLRHVDLGHLRNLGLREYNSEWPRNDFKLQHIFGASVAPGSFWYREINCPERVSDFLHAVFRLASPNVPESICREKMTSLFVHANNKAVGGRKRASTRLVSYCDSL